MAVAAYRPMPNIVDRGVEFADALLNCEFQDALESGMETLGSMFNGWLDCNPPVGLEMQVGIAAGPILHPTSYVLHPSYILHPTSYIRHPTSYIRHHTSYILHPTSHILQVPRALTSYILHHTSLSLIHI